MTPGRTVTLDGGGLGDAGVGEQGRLDLRRADAVAAGVQQVVGAAALDDGAVRRASPRGRR